jgi:4-hydroxythreonine-4-phosphate dehydrogenase
MLLLLERLRLMLFTNHMSLREVCDHVRADRILERLTLADAALRDLGVERPRIAVAGLNPHASEHGAFGREEQEEIVPAIAAARARGIDASGPFPADSLFVRARDGVWDLTLALYHDQGLIPVKLLGWGALVTLLAGLPLVRTSVGHGTAFDIAGRNLADHGNLVVAIRVATEVALRRRGAEPGIAAAHGRAA